jgi:bifunctional non-homologous end joining protein LigD
MPSRYAFDLLHLNGEDLIRHRLDERRQHLTKVLKASGLLLSDALPGTAAQVLAAVSDLGLEGVIAKRRDLRYDAS